MLRSENDSADDAVGTPVDPRSLPAAEGLRLALLELESGLDAEEERMRAGPVVEALHRYRVVLRTSRALLSGLGHAAPGDLADRFSVPLADLGRHGSEARDLDVWLERFDQIVADLHWDEADALEPLRLRLGRARDQAWAGLRESLATPEHRRLREDWRNALGEDWCAVSSTSTRLGEELSQVLERRVDRFFAHGRELAPDSPALLYHEQRKRVKKIRYLLQCFAACFDAGALERSTRPLRRAQTALGGKPPAMQSMMAQSMS